MSKKNFKIKDLFLYTPNDGDSNTLFNKSVISDEVFYREIFAPTWFDGLETGEAKRYFDEKSNFENNLSLNYGVENTFNIIGYCGSGKSIYVGYLMKKFKEENPNNYCIKLDFASIGLGRGNGISFCGKTWNSPYEARTVTYFINLIMVQLNILLGRMNLTEKKLKCYLNFNETRLERTYNQEFSVVFDILKKLDKKNISDSQYNNEIYSAIINECVDPNNEDYTAQKLFKLFFILSFSLLSNKSSGKLFIFIDSLEHYLTGVNNELIQIYNADINKIATLMNDFLCGIKHLDYFSNDYQDVLNRIRIIMSCRETSINMLTSYVPNKEDGMNYAINISDWFRVSDILDKRIDYYDRYLKNNKNYNFLERDTVGIALEYIFQDDCMKGLYEKLQEMYNHNYRRLIIFLDETLAEKKLFNDYLWLQKKIDNSFDNSSYLIRGSRQMIIGGLFRNIAKHGFFEKIKAIGEGENQLGLPYTRRILVYLKRKHPNEDILSNPNGCYVSFSDMLTEAFEKSNGDQIRDTDIEALADVILNLNESKKENNKWCQLVIIRFNNENINRDKLIAILKRARAGEIFLNEDFSLKITDAGRFYLENLKDFEYFAARYATDYKPLFCKENLQKINGEYRCLTLINKVMDRVFSVSGNKEHKACLDYLYQQEKIFLRMC